MINNFGLYPVITEEFCNGRSSVDVLKSVVKAGVKIVQLREKSKSKNEIIEVAKTFRKITKDNDVILIINDFFDIALEVGADGVHLGQEDGNCSEVRDRAPDLIIGVSTHNIVEIEKAIKKKATYINIGPVFSTGTKKNLSSVPLGINRLKELIPEISIPFTVMGGIKMENIKDLLKIGARNIAMITEITMSENVFEKTKKMVEIINNFK
jgi:thiamine-phosphate pyrophosphorylase